MIGLNLNKAGFENKISNFQKYRFIFADEWGTAWMVDKEDQSTAEITLGKLWDNFFVRNDDHFESEEVKLEKSLFNFSDLTEDEQDYIFEIYFFVVRNLNILELNALSIFEIFWIFTKKNFHQEEKEVITAILKAYIKELPSTNALAHLKLEEMGNEWINLLQLI